jgi:hypothetical protein
MQLTVFSVPVTCQDTQCAWHCHLVDDYEITQCLLGAQENEHADNKLAFI